MKNPSEMSKEQLLKWLDKTSNSLNKMWGKQNTQRAYEVVDRYHDLKEEALKRDLWDEWCAQHGFDVRHDGWDCFA